jgi:hypothetical protein
VSQPKHAYYLAFAGLFTASVAGAQTTLSNHPSTLANSSPGESSSLQTDASSEAPEMTALPSAPAANGLASKPQEGGGAAQDTSQGHGFRHLLTFEAGGGANAPTNDSSPYITWGGNFTLGAGLNFSKYLAVLAEYQFVDDKLPGALIAETGANGGDAHIWSLTLDPVFDTLPKSTNDLYVTGGGGFYRKVTSFTDPQPVEYCSYYYCGTVLVNQVVGHFSSNQGGWSVGGGYARRLGSSIYGDSHMKLFAEVRYLDIDTPAVSSSPNGLGLTTVGAKTKLIPVTIGLRF